MLSQQKPDLTSTCQVPRAGTCPKVTTILQRAPSAVTSKIPPFIAAVTYCMARNEEFSISNFNAIIKMSIKVFTVWLLVIKKGGGTTAGSCGPGHQAALNALSDFSSQFCFFLQNIFPGFVHNCPQGRWPENHMKTNLNSHMYSLIIFKKELFSSTKTPPKCQCSWAAICGGVSELGNPWGIILSQAIPARARTAKLHQHKVPGITRNHSVTVSRRNGHWSFMFQLFSRLV